MATFWVSLVSFLNKIAPWIIVGLAYFKGKAAEREAVDKANLEKQKEYAEIAAEPRSDRDVTDRMQTGTY